MLYQSALLLCRANRRDVFVLEMNDRNELVRLFFLLRRRRRRREGSRFAERSSSLLRDAMRMFWINDNFGAHDEKREKKKGKKDERHAKHASERARIIPTLYIHMMNK